MAKKPKSITAAEYEQMVARALKREEEARKSKRRCRHKELRPSTLDGYMVCVTCGVQLKPEDITKRKEGEVKNLTIDWNERDRQLKMKAHSDRYKMPIPRFRIREHTINAEMVPNNHGRNFHEERKVDYSLILYYYDNDGKEQSLMRHKIQTKRLAYVEAVRLNQQMKTDIPVYYAARRIEWNCQVSQYLIGG